MLSQQVLWASAGTGWDYSVYGQRRVLLPGDDSTHPSLLPPQPKECERASSGSGGEKGEANW